MSNRFPPIRPQTSLRGSSRGRSLAVPAPVDLTLLAALALVVAVAMV